MEERKPMYEFDLGFMGKAICSADTASFLQELVLLARQDAQKTNTTCLIYLYDEIHTKIFDTLKSIGYYNEIL